MKNNNDYADSEVKGISRYIPTNLSKGILLLLPGTAWLSFSAIREHPIWFGFQGNTELEKTLIAALVAISARTLLVIVLVIDMAVAMHQSKHRRIVHYSNENPSMSFGFLVANALTLHWLVLGLLCLSFLVAGYLFGKA